MAKPTSPLSQKVKQKQLMILGAVGLGIMLLAIGSAYMMGGQKGPPPKPIVTVTRNLVDATTDTADREKWRERSAQDIERLRQQMAEQQQLNANLQKKLGELQEAKNTEASANGAPVPPPGRAGQVVPPPAGMLPPRREGSGFLPGSPIPQATSANQAPILGGPGMVMPNGSPVNAMPNPIPAVQTIKFENKGKPAADKDTSVKRESSGRPYRTGPRGERIYLEESAYSGGSIEKTYVPAGAFARAVILGGVDAPTGGQAQSNPHPILLRILGDARLPGGARINMKDCIVTADAVGDLSSERIQIRLQRLACRIGEDKIADVSVKGHVDGEDGKAGMRGRLVTKTGQVLGNALLTGTLSALGTAIQNTTQQTLTTGLGTVTQTGGSASDMAKYAMGGGVSKAFDRLSHYYIQLAEKVFPVLELDSMRVGDIVFTQGFTIEAI